MNLIYKRYKQYINSQHATGKYRKLPDFFCDRRKSYLNFSSNDYLGLSSDSGIIEAAVNTARFYGTGATGSRLLSGNLDIFEQLELQIAKDKKRESALIFNSGFQANITTLSTLLDKSILKQTPLVFFDKLNHASLYQAIALSSPDLVRYRHCDMRHLTFLLERYIDDKRPKFIVSETLFGMDGDIAPIDDLVRLSKKFHAFLYLDEAHSTGILGENGYGLSTSVDLEGISCLIMGTFSKAIGCSGGYVACDKLVKEFLLNKAKGFIYSTANSPMVIGAVKESWKRIKNCYKERKHLKSLGDFLRSLLVREGFDIGFSTTHIVPIIIKDERKVLDISRKLLDKNILTSCIRPPSVPIGKSCIRIAICSYHNEVDLEYLVRVLRQL